MESRYGVTGIRIRVEQVIDSARSDQWLLLEPVTVTLSDGSTLFIPAGFVTDFASVPRSLWSIFAPIGWHNLAALVHDWLYDNRIRRDELGDRLARRYCDQEYRYFLKLAEPNNWLKRNAHYAAVRLFGRKFWNN